MRQVLLNATLTVLAVMIGLLIGEALVRMFHTNNPYLMPRYHTSFTYDDVRIRGIRPNTQFEHTTLDGRWHFSTNAQGFRNYENFDHIKPPETIRVVALGDSHTQGYECHQDYTFSAVIERYLRNLGLSAQVLNTGVSGFSNAEALLLLSREMVRYQPDVVILGFFANDYQDNLRANLYRLDDEGELELVNREYLPGVRVQDFIYSIPGIKWLGENSYLYSLLFNTVWDFFKHTLPRLGGQDTNSRELMIAPERGASDYETLLAARLVNQMASVSREFGAQFILLDIPSSLGADRYESSLTPGLVSLLDPTIDLIQFSDVLDRYQGVAPIHVRHGGVHITEFTHTILGTEIAEWLTRNSPAVATRLAQQSP